MRFQVVPILLTLTRRITSTPVKTTMGRKQEGTTGMDLFDGALRSADRIAQEYAAATVSQELSPMDDMIDPSNPDGLRAYLHAGRNALEIILASMVTARRVKADRILDLPCGFGRVTRHLRAAFPQAHITACDLYQDRIDYCASTFGVEALQSKEVLADLHFDQPFDLIWCGSLLTHLPKQRFAAALGLLSRALSEDGIAIATTHGRFSPWSSHERFKYLPTDAFIAAERGFYRSGFGYAPYANATEVFAQETYGISLSSMSFIGGLIETDPTIRMVGFTERGWDGHQDVVAFKKSPIYN